MKLEEARAESLKSQDYQDGWNTAHHDVTVDGTWFSINKIKESGRSQDYIEGYFASQDNLLEERARARLNDQVSNRGSENEH
mgnify:FL=1